MEQNKQEPEGNGDILFKYLELKERILLKRRERKGKKRLRFVCISDTHNLLDQMKPHKPLPISSTKPITTIS